MIASSKHTRTKPAQPETRRRNPKNAGSTVQLRTLFSAPSSMMAAPIPMRILPSIPTGKPRDLPESYQVTGPGKPSL